MRRSAGVSGQSRSESTRFWRVGKCFTFRHTQMAMARSTRDLIYRIFIIFHILPSVLLALPLVLPDSILPAWSKKPLELYLSTYNDPLGGGKSFPAGWFGGLSICEVLLQLPFFIWALTIPMGKTFFFSR